MGVLEWLGRLFEVIKIKIEKKKVRIEVSPGMVEISPGSCIYDSERRKIICRSQDGKSLIILDKDGRKKIIALE